MTKCQPPGGCLTRPSFIRVLICIGAVDTSCQANMPLLIPTPEKKAALQKIHSLLRRHKDNEDMKSLAEACRLILEDADFLPTVAANTSLPKNYETAADLLKLAWAYLYFFLSQRDYVAAAMLLWDEETFTPEPECVQDVWDAIQNNRMIGIIGSGGVGKTYSPSALFLLEWVLDPEWTRIQIASASEDHLKKNLYADIV